MTTELVIIDKNGIINGMEAMYSQKRFPVKEIIIICDCESDKLDGSPVFYFSNEEPKENSIRKQFLNFFRNLLLDDSFKKLTIKGNYLDSLFGQDNSQNQYEFGKIFPSLKKVKEIELHYYNKYNSDTIKIVDKDIKVVNYIYFIDEKKKFTPILFSLVNNSFIVEPRIDLNKLFKDLAEYDIDKFILNNDEKQEIAKDEFYQVVFVDKKTGQTTHDFVKKTGGLKIMTYDVARSKKYLPVGDNLELNSDKQTLILITSDPEQVRKNEEAEKQIIVNISNIIKAYSVY